MRHWSGQAIGRSTRRLRPKPRGRRPSTAALTISGARKASDRVIRIERTVLPSREAIDSKVRRGSERSSPSQRCASRRASIRIARALARTIPTERWRRRPVRMPARRFEIESADDFVLTHSTSITSATFTGLLPVGAPLSDIGKVVVEIYRVFPKDSDTTRTPAVPTRVNSPSDVAFAERDSESSNLSFKPSVASASFTAANSVQPGGIVIPPPHTGGDGSFTGEEVTFGVTFTVPFLPPADHYFFGASIPVRHGAFLRPSAPKPIVPPGTPFPDGFADLQNWTPDDPGIPPDWLRIGTDIVGPPATGGGTAPTFNAAFSLTGAVVPEPSSGDDAARLRGPRFPRLSPSAARGLTRQSADFVFLLAGRAMPPSAQAA